MWRRDGIGRFNFDPVPGAEQPHVLTPDDIFEDAEVHGPLVIYDEDGAYLGNLFTERFVEAGHEVVYATPHADVAPYLALTMEQHKVAARMAQMGIRIERLRRLVRVGSGDLSLAALHGEDEVVIDAKTVLMLTSRSPNDAVYQGLAAREDEWSGGGIKSVSRIGDCEAPSIIAAAVHSGHRWARQLDAESIPNVPFLPTPLSG